MTALGDDDRLAQVIRYHDRTKHDFQRYARGPGQLDWMNQPDPFRRYEGAPLFLLPFKDDEPATRYDDLYMHAVEAQPLTLQTIGWFFEWSLGVSATKSAGGMSWKLRCNPSSGNLHPTEGYAVLPAIEGIADTPAVYHYRADEHGLEQRCSFSPETWTSLSSGFPSGTFFVGLSSIHWRETWKYGERALRYCNHDVGHALGALRYAAAALGWRCAMLDALGDAEITALLGLDREPGGVLGEREHPDMVLAIVTNPGIASVPNSLARDPITTIAGEEWRGLANMLSGESVEWPIIDETASACAKPSTAPRPHSMGLGMRAPETGHESALAAGRIFRQRRSAVDMDNISNMSRDAFYRLLERAMPRDGRPPFDAWPHAPQIHLGLFVHRVEGLQPGLYFLVRNATHLDELKSSMRSEFTWSTPPDCPVDLPLYRFATADSRGLAAQLSCLQTIAGAGAFSLGMLARFDAPLREHGAWFYRRLFWEAGLVGQALYLEAEAAGLRATGIGCYFDDPVHRVFGLTGHAFQSLYHFTIGGPVDDPRLTNLPPYTPERHARQGWV